VSDQLIGLLIAARAARPRPFGYITRLPHATSPTPRSACRSRSKLFIQNYRGGLCLPRRFGPGGRMSD
jgi:hypothetical protein